MQCRRFDGHGADRVVWTVIGSNFVDGQKLDEFESDSCGPINKLPQRSGIPDSQIVLAAQREQRRENSRNLLLR